MFFFSSCWLVQARWWAWLDTNSAQSWRKHKWAQTQLKLWNRAQRSLCLRFSVSESSACVAEFWFSDGTRSVPPTPSQTRRSKYVGQIKRGTRIGWETKPSPTLTNVAIKGAKTGSVNTQKIDDCAWKLAVKREKGTRQWTLVHVHVFQTLSQGLLVSSGPSSLASLLQDLERKVTLASKLLCSALISFQSANDDSNQS